MKKEAFILASETDLINKLNSELRDIIKDEFNQKEKMSKKSTKASLLTRAEVCAYLHISYATLHRYVNYGIIECYKCGRRSLFKQEQIDSTLIKLNAQGGLIL